MRNFKLTIEYDGGRYDGWIRLGKDESGNTIEGRIKEVLSKMLGESVDINVGMRTETGVHAYGQVANFKADTKMTCIDIKNYLNRYLPRDIAVVNVSEMDDRFHAALNAKAKTYLYRIDTNDVADVFERRYKYNAFKKLNVTAMEEVLALFEGRHDFKKFSSAKKNKTTEKNVIKTSLVDDGCEIQLRITANDFLHNMARYMFGCVLEAGNGRLSINQVKEFLDTDSAAKPEVMAEPVGMFIETIEY